MNVFDKASQIEEIATKHILPWLAVNGAKVLETKDSEFLQRHWGDWVQCTQNGIYRSIELKAEESNKHGNFFFETWSNRESPFWTVGWLYSCKADYLFYYFVKEQVLYVISFAHLREWAFGTGNDGQQGNIYQYRERPQLKYNQKNKTWGRCVPIQDLMPYKWVYAYQYSGDFTFKRLLPTAEQEAA